MKVSELYSVDLSQQIILSNEPEDCNNGDIANKVIFMKILMSDVFKSSTILFLYLSLYLSFKITDLQPNCDKSLPSVESVNLLTFTDKEISTV